MKKRLFVCAVAALTLLFAGCNQRPSTADNQALFRAFIKQYVNEVNPVDPVMGGHWLVGDDGIDFRSDTLARVTAEDGHIQSIVDYVFQVEGTEVRILRATPVLEDEIREAQNMLTRFLGALRDGRYLDAVEFYGGSYQPIKELHPTVSRPAVLWELFCQESGGACLAYEVVGQEELGSGRYAFRVIFSPTPETRLNVRECQSEDICQVVSEFRFQVETIDDRLFVTTLPPMSPELQQPAVTEN